MRLPAALLTVVLGAACSSSQSIQVGNWDQLTAQTRSGDSQAVLVFFWATWSRRSVELLPAVRELALEHEGADVRWLSVCLNDEPEQARADAMHLLGEDSSPFETWIVPVDFDRMLAEYGAAEPPAAVFLDSSGQVRRLLSGTDLTPAALADALATAP